ncbi:MAG: cytochrome c biogenesis protein CcsA [Actinobacteria bacterium]|nr:cytochrome c biogenesis protein CcsA [Actinomycetota bacterium]
MTFEIVLTWIALTFYAVAAAVSAIGVIFSKDTLTNRAVLVCAIGLAFQTASLGIRWERVGHGPYLGFYEVASALVLFAIAAFVIAAWRNPRLAGAGIGIMPVALLLLGGSMLAQKSAMPMTAKLASWWLYVHVTFANLAFGAFVLSFGCAIVYVVRVRSATGKWAKRFEKLPAQDVLENLTVRFVLVGFLFWAMMITTGAIWANEAWGRYWGWDPIETWSLIVWLIYAVYLHVRFALKWRGERLAWFAIVAMLLALFALVGIPLAFNTPHAGIGGFGKDL